MRPLSDYQPTEYEMMCGLVDDDPDEFREEAFDRLDRLADHISPQPALADLTPPRVSRPTGPVSDDETGTGPASPTED